MERTRDEKPDVEAQNAPDCETKQSRATHAPTDSKMAKESIWDTEKRTQEQNARRRGQAAQHGPQQAQQREQEEKQRNKRKETARNDQEKKSRRMRQIKRYRKAPVGEQNGTRRKTYNAYPEGVKNRKEVKAKGHQQNQNVYEP